MCMPNTHQESVPTLHMSSKWGTLLNKAAELNSEPKPMLLLVVQVCNSPMSSPILEANNFPNFPSLLDHVETRRLQNTDEEGVKCLTFVFHFIIKF